MKLVPIPGFEELYKNRYMLDLDSNRVYSCYYGKLKKHNPLNKYTRLTGRDGIIRQHKMADLIGQTGVQPALSLS